MSTSFEDLSLPSTLTTTLTSLGYESPTQIQTESIPILLDGNDLLAQAQTGTGKTAAFSLPILAQIKEEVRHPQALILAPTRELAIQVADALTAYSRNMPACVVTAIYGGSAYDRQIKALKRGSHIVVGTPGRVIDHMKKGTLKTDDLSWVVLDEADEMLNMGFIDDIEWILGQVEHKPQTALFSATMGGDIKNIVHRYLENPKRIQIKKQDKTSLLIQQQAMIVPQSQKMGALMTYLETENIVMALIFVRTKSSAADLCERLVGWGYQAAALHGDVVQSMRERVIQRARSGKLNIIVGTDVAARGIDIDTMSHVINFDSPADVETYTHRIGRTGRAGKSGKSLFFSPSAHGGFISRLQKSGHAIEPISMPSEKDVQRMRMEKLSNEVLTLLEKGGRGDSCEVLQYIKEKGDFQEADIVAALVHLLQRKQPKAPRVSGAPKRSYNNNMKRGGREGGGGYPRKNSRSRPDSGGPRRPRSDSGGSKWSRPDSGGPRRPRSESGGSKWSRPDSGESRRPRSDSGISKWSRSDSNGPKRPRSGGHKSKYSD
jgi:ATP-dependent RNA helicase DeaD